MSLLEVKRLSVVFNKTLKALDNVSFQLEKGEVLGIVGESGSGKSTIARTLLQLQNKTSGEVYWKGQNNDSLTKAEKQEYRKQVQMIFQDPLDALNPRMTVGQIIAEPLGYLKPELNKQQVAETLEQIMQSMGLSKEQANRYPHEFSGGQCQRIGIARAMIVEPELLVCDEPVSALDVSIQAQIINLLIELKTKKQLSMLFISHDLSVVKHLCDRVMVLYKGKIVEIAPTKELYKSPKSTYTKQLLASIPLHNPKEERQRVISWGNSK